MSVAEPVILTEKIKAQETDAERQWIGSLEYSWTVMAGILIFWAILFALYLGVLRNTGGKFIYALDDAYISAAMGRNLAQHGILGVTRYGFTSSSSSIIWPLLLALFDLVLRLPEFTPFILNVTLGTALIAFFYVLLRRVVPDAPSAYLFVFISALILFVPLPLLAFVGLEHILHIIATLGFAYFASLELSTNEPTERRATALLIFAALVTLARYEGMFMVAPTAALFALRCRWRHCGQVLAAGFAPVVIYGLCSKAAGWLFLPSSVLAKSDDPGNVVSRALSFHSYNKIFLVSEVQVLFLIAGVLFFAAVMRTGGLWNRRTVLLLISLTTTLAHLRVAKTGAFFRYEAYLIALGLFAIGCALHEELRQLYPTFELRTVVVCSFIVFTLWNEGAFLMQRARAGLLAVPIAAKNIYEQQYQMARFVRQYYPGAIVVANDIGAVNFFGDIHCIDLAGLGTIDITKLILDGKVTRGAVSSYVKDNHGQIAIMYEDWYSQSVGLPPEWVKVGSWSIQRNLVEGGDTVSFFALQPAEIAPLKEHLRDFANQLPATVQQEGAYLSLR
jgi:hypothetical protein